MGTFLILFACVAITFVIVFKAGMQVLRFIYCDEIEPFAEQNQTQKAVHIPKHTNTAPIQSDVYRRAINGIQKSTELPNSKDLLSEYYSQYMELSQEAMKRWS